jgi:hypothetical protein
VDALDGQGMKFVTAAVVLFSGLALAAARAQVIEPEWPTERHIEPQESSPASAVDQKPSQGDGKTTTKASSICQMIESAATANGLPVEFFAEIIWQESRLRSDAIGPVTRSGLRAQGIAQFMPSTAAERLLQNPFDPDQALPKSAEFLRGLEAQFGSLGLAAAAYNAGPQRVRDWLAAKRTLPRETQRYVRDVTGHSVEEWARRAPEALTVATSRAIPCDNVAKSVAKISPAEPTQHDLKYAWAVQLIGDPSASKALARYRLMQSKHEDILGAHEPVVIGTTLGMGAAPIWSRVRVDASTREGATALCTRLRAVGESCIIQRN